MLLDLEGHAAPSGLREGTVGAVRAVLTPSVDPEVEGDVSSICTPGKKYKCTRVPRSSLQSRIK